MKVKWITKDKYSIVCFLFYFDRPLVQQKLDVLGQAGLSKDNFSDADTRNLKVG